MSPIAYAAPALETFAVFALAGAALVAARARAASIALTVAALAAATTVAALGRWQAVPLAVVAVAFIVVLGTAQLRFAAAPAMRWRILLFCLALGAAFPIWLFPIPRMPEPDGPFAVGTATADWMHRFPDGSRRLKVRLWYPAAGSPAAATGPYLAPEESAGTAAVVAQFASLPAWAYSYLSLTRTNGRVDAAPAAGRPHPLVLFSHGYWFYSAQNTALAELLASHGFVVASVAHPGDSAPVSYSDGTLVETVPYGDEEESPGQLRFLDATTDAERIDAYPQFQAEIRNHRILASLRRWREDVVAVLDDLQSGTAGGAAAALSPAIDFSRVAFVGMSFGGSVSASTCAIDPRCVAAVNMDGFEYDAAMFDRDIGIPLLMLLSDRDTYRQWNRNYDRDHALNDFFYERHAATKPAEHIYRVRVSHLQHLGFSDLPLAMRRPIRTGFAGALDRHQAVESVNAAVLGFLERYLRGDAEAFSAARIEEIPALDIHLRDRIELPAGSP